MFFYVLGRFPVDKVCSVTSRVDFWSSECVPPCPVSISGRQSVFCRVLGRFPNGRVHSATSRSISGRQSMFRHVPGRFPVVTVCSATFQVNFRSAECVPPCPVLIFSWQSVFCHIPDQFPHGKVRSTMSRSISGQQSVFHYIPD